MPELRLGLRPRGTLPTPNMREVELPPMKNVLHPKYDPSRLKKSQLARILDRFGVHNRPAMKHAHLCHLFKKFVRHDPDLDENVGEVLDFEVFKPEFYLLLDVKFFTIGRLRQILRYHCVEYRDDLSLEELRKKMREEVLDKAEQILANEQIDAGVQELEMSQGEEELLFDLEDNDESEEVADLIAQLNAKCSV